MYCLIVRYFIKFGKVFLPFFFEFGTIDVSEIDKIELSGTTGGKDGNFSYTLSDQEKKEFVHLLNQVWQSIFTIFL